VPGSGSGRGGPWLQAFFAGGSGGRLRSGQEGVAGSPGGVQGGGGRDEACCGSTQEAIWAVRPLEAANFRETGPA
jgi:hypothetical protein